MPIRWSNSTAPISSIRSRAGAATRPRASACSTSAKGATVTDADGRTLVDGFAGLWCVNAGYGHESVVAAAERQLRDLPYATGYFGLGSEPAIRLAARLAELAPGDLDHVYFTLGGSDAVDSTVRFVRYYWNARGKPQKDQFISLEQGYHGSSTVGAGLTALPAFHAGFGVPYDWQHKIPSHYAYRNPVGSDPQAIITPRSLSSAPRSRRSAGRSASPPSTPSRSRARAACWCRLQAG